MTTAAGTALMTGEENLRMGEPWKRNEDDAGGDGQGGDGGQDGHGEQRDDAWMQYSGELGVGQLAGWWSDQWTTGEWHRNTGAPDYGGSVIAPPKTYPTSPLWPRDEDLPPLLPPSDLERQPPQPQPMRGPPYTTPLTMRLPQPVGVGNPYQPQPPQYLPGGPAGGLAQQRFGEEQRMFAATQAGRLSRRTGAPLNVTTQAMHSTTSTYVNGRLRLQDRGLALYCGELDEHLLSFMVATEQESSLTYAATFLQELNVGEGEMALPSGYRESFWRSVLEPFPLRRFLTAWAWARWYYWRDVNLAILDMHPGVHLHAGSDADRSMPPSMLATGWWPVRPPRTASHWPGPFSGAIWRPEHARYYSFMWRMVCDVLCHRFQLETLTAEYLMLDECPPWRSEAHGAAIFKFARRMGIPEQDAMGHYTRFLAQESGVPLVMIRSRLYGQNGISGDYPMDKPEHLLHLTHDLILEYPELGLLRMRTARRWMLHADELALWILEPAAMLLPQRVRRTGA